ncbi:hypothetical protein BDZ89DRAFT_19740 [Hymenopellis radicata]|nr:hypothetical protein BDZ89DRAFT_19740 [Hymenopellis radicata]
MEDIPDSSPSQSLGDALRVTVMTRILCDRQTREERVEPIIRSNIALLPAPSNRPLSTPDQLVTEFAQGPRAAQIAAAFYSDTRDLLKRRFNEREVARLGKIKHLQEQYLELNERWKAHCRLLEGQSKVTPLLELENLNSSGRTTRRTATLGDAVRSDLEMEQIIASLGNDEATDPTFLSGKNHADIPDMISVEHGVVEFVYDDSNLLVENAAEYYRPRTGMDDWTEEERQIFLDQFAAHPKQFGIIADALPHKTAAQCVAFYYLHKKRSIDFRDVVATHAPKRRRRRTGKQKANALLADIRQHDAEVWRDNEVTGTGRAKRRAATRRPLLDDLATATPTPEPEGRSKRRRATGAKSNLAEEVDDDDEEDPKPAKKARKTRKVKSVAIIEESLTPEGKSVDPSDTLQRRKPSVATSRWSDDDKRA